MTTQPFSKSSATMLLSALLLALTGCSSAHKCACKAGHEKTVSTEIEKVQEMVVESDLEVAEEETSDDLREAVDDFLASDEEESEKVEPVAANQEEVDIEDAQEGDIVEVDEEEIVEVSDPELEEDFEAAPVAEARAMTKSSFKNAMYNVAKDCNLRSQPSMRGSVVGKSLKGRRIWAENANSSWAKVYRQSGDAAYIYKGCL